MTYTSGFFNSVNHDRTYDADAFGSMFDGVIKDGVFRTWGKGMFVATSGGMSVTVGTGRAWFNHTWTLVTSDEWLSLPSAPTSMARIDSVVLRIDKTNPVRANKLYIKRGRASGEPVRPSLERTNLVQEYTLADIRINAGVTGITQSNITNQIGRDTPFVELVDNTFDSGNLIRQWERQFQEFIEKSTFDPRVLSPIANYTIDQMFNIN
nr:MAG TPA: Receptor Binding Protein [Caudoviricetes sp.]